MNPSFVDHDPLVPPASERPGNDFPLRVFSLEPLGARGGLDVLDRSFHSALAQMPGVEVIWATGDVGTPADPSYERWSCFRQAYGEAPMWWRGIQYLQALLGLVRRATRDRATRATVIHQQHLQLPIAEHLAMRMAVRHGIPWFITPHEAVPYGASLNRSGPREHLLRSATGLFAMSETNRSELSQVLGHASPHIFLTPLGHLNAFRGRDAQVAQVEARTRMGLPVGPPLVLFLGELRSIKGLDILLRAMALVVAQIPEARLLVSSRPHRARTEPHERLVHELGLGAAVEFRWRFVDETELALLHRAVDLVALPYRHASQSAACMTAYAFRRPVVASAVGGLTEQVVEGETGSLVPPENPEALAAALIRLLSNRAHLASLGESAYRWAERARDWAPIARQTVEAYRLAFQNRR